MRLLIPLALIATLFNLGQCQDQSIQTNSSFTSAWRKVKNADDAPKAKWNRFFGFVEGRLGVAPPSWWESLVVGVTFHENGRIFVPNENVWPYTRSKSGFLTRPQQKVQIEDAGVTVSVATKQILIPKTLFDMARTSGPVDIIEIHVTGEHAFVGLGGLNARQYILAKIIATTGVVEWQTNVFRNRGVESGRGFHFFEIVCAGDTIVVFGAGDDCVYIEQFSDRDGTKKLRFAGE